MRRSLCIQSIDARDQQTKVFNSTYSSK